MRTLQRRKAASAAGTDQSGVSDLGRGIRRREVPSDPEQRTAMRGLVDQQLGQMERAGRWLPYYLAAMGLIAAFAIVAGVWTGAVLAPVLGGAGLVWLLVVVVVIRRRNLARLHSMRDALREGPDDGNAPGGTVTRPTGR